MQNLSRRNYLKKSALGLGAAFLAPHIGFSESRMPALPLDVDGNLAYSPLYKEFIPDRWYDTEAIAAKLNANENPHGPSPKAMKALSDNLSKSNRYAWKELYSLIDQIATYEGVQSENVLMGPGSSDILEKTAMILFQNGGNVVSADPAYMSLVKVAQATGATWKSVPLKDWAHDLDAMEAAIDEDTKLVYICNPNNPTGTITDAAKLKEFCSRVSEKVTVFVDEAYLDLIENGIEEQSMRSLVQEGKDIIVARTFSKIHGMAGLRVGYAIAPESTLEKFRAITRGGMGISHPAVYAAKASMNDASFIEKSRMLNTASRDYTFETLKTMGHDPVPSFTSFMIFPIEMEGKDFLGKMNDLKVSVRAFQFMDKNWCRVSMGTMDEMKLFASTIGKVIV